MYALQAGFRITLQLESHCLHHSVSPTGQFRNERHHHYRIIMDRNLQPIQFRVVSPVSWRIGKSASIQMIRLHLPRTDDETPHDSLPSTASPWRPLSSHHLLYSFLSGGTG